jgi:hypothetical protein
MELGDRARAEWPNAAQVVSTAPTTIFPDAELDVDGSMIYGRRRKHVRLHFARHRLMKSLLENRGRLHGGGARAGREFA